MTKLLQNILDLIVESGAVFLKLIQHNLITKINNISTKSSNQISGWIPAHYMKERVDGHQVDGGGRRRPQIPAPSEPAT